HFAEEIGKLDPAKLLEPLTEVFKKLNDAVGGLSGAKLVDPARALIDKALAALQPIAPEKLLAPIEQAFEHDVLAPLQQFKPSTLLKPLIDASAPLQELIDKLDFASLIGTLPTQSLPAPAALLDAWNNALDAALQALNPGRLFEPIQSALAPVED